MLKKKVKDIACGNNMNLFPSLNCSVRCLYVGLCALSPLPFSCVSPCTSVSLTYSFFFKNYF